MPGNQGISRYFLDTNKSLPATPTYPLHNVYWLLVSVLVDGNLLATALVERHTVYITNTGEAEGSATLPVCHHEREDGRQMNF